MFGGIWEITCIKDYKPYDSLPDLIAFESGKTYRVKDKFPDEHGDIEKGVWEVSNGASLFDLDYNTRKEYFQV